MKYLKQFMVIMVLSFVGEVLHEILPVPVPGSIYGIVLLFLLLETGHLPLDVVRETGKFLVEIMPVMFIPAAVGLIDAWDVIRPSWLSYMMITVVSTIVVMAVAGRVTQAVIRRKQRRESR